MTATLTVSATRDTLGVKEWLDGKITELAREADQFIDKTRRELLWQEPSPELLAEHKLASRLLIGMTRMVICQLEDPDFPQPAAARRLGLRLHQMQAFHDTLHNPMDEAEADRILAAAFPDAP